MRTFEEIEQYALEHYVPIARKDTVNFLIDIINKNNYKSVLEIGSAIGYTSIHLALLDNVFVTTYEMWPERFKICKENINDFGVKDKIKLVTKDVLKSKIKGKYDLIFVDASKSKTIEIFEYVAPYLNDNGTIIIDNIDLKVVETIESEKKKRRYNRIINKTKNYFTNLQDFAVTYDEVGDGVYIVKRK